MNTEDLKITHTYYDKFEFPDGHIINVTVHIKETDRKNKEIFQKILDRMLRQEINQM